MGKKTIQLKIYLNGTQSEKSIKRKFEYLITCGKKKITSTLKKSQQAKTNFFQNQHIAQIIREKLCKKSECILNFLKGEFMNVLDLLREKDFLKLPKPLVLTFGADETVMLMELLTGYDHWEKLGRAEDGWIFPTCSELEKRVNFAQPKQNRILDKLEKMGVLLIKRRKDFGRLRPKRRAIKINEEVIKNIFMWNKE